MHGMSGKIFMSVKIVKIFNKRREENVESPSLDGFLKRSDKHHGSDVLDCLGAGQWLG